MNTAKALSYVNEALVQIGDRPITSFADGSDRAKAADVLYEPALRWLLAQHRWEFATVQQQLAQIAGFEPLIDWSFAYDLPTDPEYLHVVRIARTADSLATSANLVWPRHRRLDYAIRNIRTNPADDGTERQALLTHWAEVWLEYVGRVDEAAFPPAFEQALVVAIAQRLAKALSDDTDLRENLKDELMGTQRAPGLLSIAKTRDSKNSPNAGFVDDAGFVSHR